MKKLNVTPNGSEVVDMTAEEISDFEYRKDQAVINREKKQEAKEANEALKASAKAKLIAGEALTAEEADTIVL